MHVFLFQVQLEINNIQCRIVNLTQATALMRAHMNTTRSLSAESLHRLREDPEEIQKYKQKLDAQMESILSQLVLFEGHLRKEQIHIRRTWEEKDKVMLLQKEALVELVHKNEQLRAAHARMKDFFQALSASCDAKCVCSCHQLYQEYFPVRQTNTDAVPDDEDIVPSTDIDEEIRRLDNEDDDVIQKCTISLNKSMTKPRRIVESGSIKELAKHHRQRRASGGSNQKDKTAVTRSNSLPDAKLMHVLQVRAKSLSECTLLQQGKTGSDFSPGESPSPTSLHLWDEAKETSDENWSKGNTTIFDEEGNEVRDNPVFYDMDEVHNALHDDNFETSGKFKFVKSPPNQSPNKNPKRPKEFKKRHKLKSNPEWR